MIDFRSLPKKWNDTSLSDLVVLPEFKQSSAQWPMFAMLALGLVIGAAIGGFAVSQRTQMKRLAKHAKRMSDDLADMADGDEVKPATRSNHGRKSTAEV